MKFGDDIGDIVVTEKMVEPKIKILKPSKYGMSRSRSVVHTNCVRVKKCSIHSIPEATDLLSARNRRDANFLRIDKYIIVRTLPELT